jgi:hypothetical protein
MVPTGDMSGTVATGVGIAGQNSATPAQKIFGHHDVLRYTDSSGVDILYDPSYGTTYTDQGDFFSQSVTGYAQVQSTNTSSLTLGIRKNN